MNGLEQLRQQYPWPPSCPDVPADAEGWFCGENRAVLQRRIAGAQVILELGAWKGMSTRWLADHSAATVITIDHWLGSSEHQGRPELPRLYDTFIRNCWEYRDRIIAVKESTLTGMQIIHDLGITPQDLYVDASHEADAVAADLALAMQLWPKAHIVGDDWCWTSVKAGVCRVLAAGSTTPEGRKFVGRFTCYEFFPEGADVVA